MAVDVLLLDFFGTIVEYNASRREQGFQRTHRVIADLGCHYTYTEFLDAWGACFKSLDDATASDHREYSMDEGAVLFLADALGRQPDDQTVNDVVDTYLAEWSKGVHYLPGVAGLVRDLSREYRLAVVTNTHHPRLVPGHLAAMGLQDAFAAVITSVEVGHRKPHPSIYAEALTRMNTDATRVVFIGDTYDADYAGPRRVGMRAFLIDPAHRHELVDDRHRLPTILELPAALASVAER